MSINRRDFIKSTAFGAGLMIAPSFSLRAENKKFGANDKVNFAVVGFGAEGQVLSQSLAKIPGTKCVAVCDIMKFRRDQAQKFFYAMSRRTVKPNSYEDYKELIANEKDLDAVIIATPDFWHAPQTNDFLAAGVNVYCEKMMAETKEKAASMVRAQRKSGKLLQIGHQRTSNIRYQYVKDVLIKEKQLIGRLVNANGQWNRSVTKDLELPKKFKVSDEFLNKYGYENEHQFCNWRWFKGLGGGPLSDLGAHQIDIFGWLFGGRPIDVMAGGDCSYYNKEWYDNVMCIMTYNTFQGHTARAFYQVLTATGAGGGYFEQFMGDKGAIKMSENPALTKVYKENYLGKDAWDKYIQDGTLKASTAPVVVTKKADVRESGPLAGYDLPVEITGPIHMPHLLNFFNAIRGKAKLNCDAEHAFEREAAVHKIVEAIEAKKTLTFSDSDFVVS